MKTQTYAVAIERKAVDYILVSATSEREAVERANLLVQEGEEEITLGINGTDDEVLSADAYEPDDDTEREHLQLNNEAVAGIMKRDSVGA